MNLQIKFVHRFFTNSKIQIIHMHLEIKKEKVEKMLRQIRILLLQTKILEIIKNFNYLECLMGMAKMDKQYQDIYHKISLKFCQKQAIYETFKIIQQAIYNLENNEGACSGSTAVILIIYNDIIYSANIGDSRAIMAVKNTDWELIELTEDQNPKCQSEADRVVLCGATVDKPQPQNSENQGPLRVWIDLGYKLGLCMTRSIGDNDAKKFGIIWDPIFKNFKFPQNDKYIILASDGLWEFISSQEAMDYVIPFHERNDPEGACDYLLQLSHKYWVQDSNNQQIDDITIIVIFFQ